jgi:hypothetical protein
MVINYKRFQVIEKQAVFDIHPNYYLIVVKFIKRNDEEVVEIIETNTLDGYIDVHDYKDYQIVKIFCYTLNSEIEGYDYTPNYEGVRFN